MDQPGATLLAKIRAKYPQYSDIPDTALGARIYTKYPDAYPELKPFADAMQGGASYMPSETIGSHGMRGDTMTEAQRQLATPKPAFTPAPQQMQNLGPLGNGTSQQPIPQGIGYDL